MVQRVFDVHVHFVSRDDEYTERVERLLEYAQEFNVKKIVLIGNFGSNHLVERAFKEYPDIFLGLARIDMDSEKPDIVDEYKNRGFAGLKVILTAKDYDDPSYFPFYEKAERNNMVVLFHTGIIGGPVDYLLQERSAMSEYEDQIQQILKGKSSARMRSIFLDTIANTFPKLKIIGAHLGWPEYMVSCAIARWRKNVFFDVSGGEVVRRHIIEGKYIKREISVSKVLFGTDSNIEKMPTEVICWYDSLRAMGLSYEEIDAIMYSNAARIFDVEE
ncbi:amidohydrolase family protein [Pseudothermotoga sp.]|nr:amidohydrolase family protein [Pseudothermotoga sp.]MCX7813456.1 amidohydrolase family protein [Pseudothermotoga sp.]MDW8139556.1 amidohydrolase family protein [Pseudothermotoga sp.]